MDISSMSSPVMDTNSVKPVVTPATGVKPSQVEASVVSPNIKTQQDTEQAIQNQVEQVNSKLEQLGLGLTFSVDENTQSSVVKVIDKTTDEIIKQYPNEDSLKMMKNIQDYLDSVHQSNSSTKESLTGVLFNEII
ncbi:flagellar protein FlaG [Thiomicrorhabdus sp. Kp2]|uniref:flagellar protein FlaG n=1 Tax=Thiomicrorhabdus sp. Kp2 TaxID=1123518 RepID=UPI00040405A1|nr:flagellar protein FlaG [Thiomicrorhabdus sp. Kp2]